MEPEKAPNGALSSEEVELVRASFEEAMVDPEATTGLFYGRLFELDPSVRPLFKGDMREQGRKLTKTLRLMVSGLEEPERVVPALKALGRRHVDYGVEERHYETVGGALLWALRRRLGEGFSPEAEDAWARAYGEMASVMKQAARHQ